ncbi:MAG TPA: papain-like cysteine protease family protein [Candidatus Angelobacter sp.]
MGKQLGISLKPQECSQWCWASVTSAIATLFQDAKCPSEQCQLANQMVGASNDCCTDCHCATDPFDACNQAVNLGVALAHYRLGRDGTNGFKSITFDDVRDEIEDDHPVAVSIMLDDPAAISHAIVIFGYTDDGKLNIADPMQPETQISATMDELRNGNASGLHGTFQTAFRTKRRDE